MGVLFCCVFFVKCRHRRPWRHGAGATGPSVSVCVCCWLLAHSPPVLTACVLLCTVLAVLVESKRTPSDQRGPQPRAGPGGPSSASRLFRTPVTVSGSHFLPVTWTSPAAGHSGNFVCGGQHVGFTDVHLCVSLLATLGLFSYLLFVANTFHG